MILSPQEEITKTIAKISYGKQSVSCSFIERNDIFRCAVRSCGLRWSQNDKLWLRKINIETSGLPEHRAAELSASLINIGISCDVNDTIYKLITDASWEPEQKRWVVYANGKLGLKWRGNEENIYRKSLMLPASTWDKETKSVVIPIMYYEEVIGFSEEHEFMFTQKAKELISHAKINYKKIVLPEIIIPEKKTTQKQKRTEKSPLLYDDKMNNLSVTTELYEHQKKAIEKIKELKCAGLFMDMGTGKTRCAIEYAYLKQQRISKVVWFTPVSLKTTIAEEIKKHTTGENVYIFGKKEKQPDVFWYVVGIESVSSSKWLISCLDKLIDKNTLVVVDESSYIKGYSALRTIRIIYLSKRSRYRLLLTGTPISQGISDLYSQMKFLSPAILGYCSFYSFSRQHLVYSEKHPGLILRTNGVERITEKISPYVHQITKDECLDLPKKIYDTVYFDLTEDQNNAYIEAKSGILNGILDNDIPNYMIFKLFTELQQIVSGFWNHNDRKHKLKHNRIKTLQTVLDGLGNEKVVIWCKYLHSVKEIQRKLKICAVYYGDLSIKKRDEELKKFKETDCKYFIATMSCGGHGLTINEAKYHIFYENEFKYSHRIQAEDRSHRIGQTSNVTYIDIVSNSGIDKRIQAALCRKEDVVKSFIEEVKKTKEVNI